MYEEEERPARCSCGRFMKQVWFLTGEHDDDWQDDWICKNPRHKEPTA
ncbi:hypothetical protein EDF22_0624 [Rathayibacter sp. PhB127]|nr:hypothetical protein [Rathayibacter sp. PhB127]ROS28893.1 hypothetical protein EDF22_0624 [Rathayibacter sp. PhB127]